MKGLLCLALLGCSLSLTADQYEKLIKKEV